jgi:NarL family two-component system response regulator LiaR
MISIFIVEDIELTRLALKTVLTHSNFRLVGEATDGITALRLLTERQPQVVLMDIGLPGMDGIQVTRQLKATEVDSRILMLTSHEDATEILEAFWAGADSYCLKDASPETLINAIEATAGGHSWIDPRIAKVILGALPAKPAHTQFDLSERELEVLKLMTEGLSNAEMSDKLCISPNTVKTHIKNIFQKLGVDDRTAAALKALKARII